MPRGRPKKVNKQEELKIETTNEPIEEKKEVNIETISLVNKDKMNKIKEMMKEVNKKFDDPDMLKFADAEPPKESIPFNNKYLDSFMAGGGVKGNFVVYWGSEGVGKTTLALIQVASVQAMGGIAAYIDLEHTIDMERAKMFGVKPEELLLNENAENAEQAMDIVIKLAKTKCVDLIIVDSIQALSPKEENISGKSEQDRPMEDAEIAALAKKMGKFLRRTAGSIYKGKCSVILIGQARTGGIGTFITKDDLTGGRAVKFWSMQTIYMRKGQGADAPVERILSDEVDKNGKPLKKDKRVGFDCVLRIDKNKKSNSQPELSELHIPYYFARGFSNEKS